jgi:hypothetical protein
MKKIMLLLLATISIIPQGCIADRGGDAAIGLIGGFAAGTMVGSAVASEHNRSSRAEREAVRAQDKADQVRVEQERERVTSFSYRYWACDHFV